MAHYGWDCASAVTGSLIDSARNAAGGNGYFWVRYVSPSPAATVVNRSASAATDEMNALENHDLNHYVLLSEPSQSRLGTTGSTGTSNGQDDARTFAQSMKFVYNNVNHFFPGSDCFIYAYLGMEGGSSISSAYWNGWAQIIATATLKPGLEPYLESLYCTPNNGHGSCANTSPAAVWANEPEPCSACNGFGSVSWNPDTCSGVKTELWQNAEHDGCASVICNNGYSANVDFDMTNDDSAGARMWNSSDHGC